MFTPEHDTCQYHTHLRYLPIYLAANIQFCATHAIAGSKQANISSWREDRYRIVSRGGTWFIMMGGGFFDWSSILYYTRPEKFLKKIEMSSFQLPRLPDGDFCFQFFGWIDDKIGV
ncbi:hypothetical protein B9Z19DRAFT_1078229 [Tuber borchii]|uniref:Uncharacterized protein n=1 Tax=Tuber borchii TaxID=42251 RepID=A0A2T6ZZP2_TUBBO|nr:hypothetical protein B9Z19DRAFT_1078229 [Tuber borchii]